MIGLLNNEERNDDTQSRMSRDPRRRFINEVEVSDVSGDDYSIGTMLEKVMSKP